MEEALKAYAVAADYGVADVTTAATYRIATVYRDFGKALMTLGAAEEADQGRARAVQRAARGAGLPVRGEGDRAARGQRAPRRERRLRQVGARAASTRCASCARCATARSNAAKESSMRSAERRLRGSARSPLAARRRRLLDGQRRRTTPMRDAVTPSARAARRRRRPRRAGRAARAPRRRSTTRRSARRRSAPSTTPAGPCARPRRRGRARLRGAGAGQPRARRPARQPRRDLSPGRQAPRSRSAELEQAVKLSPRQPIYLNQLGIAYRQQGQFAKARDAYETRDRARSGLRRGGAQPRHPVRPVSRRRARARSSCTAATLRCTPSGDATVTKWVADLKNRKPGPITVSRQEKP